MPQTETLYNVATSDKLRGYDNNAELSKEGHTMVYEINIGPAQHYWDRPAFACWHCSMRYAVSNVPKMSPIPVPCLYRICGAS